MKFSLILLSILILTSCSSMHPAFKTKYQDKTLFTAVNIWYEDPTRLYSTNYHVGTIIPAGTEVKIVDLKKDKIVFHAKGRGNYSMDYVREYSYKPIEIFIDKIFKSTNIMTTNKFSKEELDAIKSGKLKEGLSKDVTIIVYGYPPVHRTPTLDDDTWVYWIHRFKTINIQFSNGKIEAIDAESK